MEKEVFKKLSVQQQVKALYLDGTFIIDIRFYEYKINLYLFENFLVEVFYQPVEDRIDKIEVMEKNSKRLNFYTDQIKLPDFC